MGVIELTKDNFNETIEREDIVIIDFWAKWCGPCRAFAPIFDKAAGRHEGVTFAKIDTEAQRELAAAFGIQKIPTLMAFRGQLPVFRQVGMLRPAQLDELVGKLEELDMDEVRKMLAEHEAEHAKQEGDDAEAESDSKPDADADETAEATSDSKTDADADGGAAHQAAEAAVAAAANAVAAEAVSDEASDDF